MTKKTGTVEIGTEKAKTEDLENPETNLAKEDKEAISQKKAW